MSEALANLFQRRSIRQYTLQEVSEELVKTLLEAAMAAPSAANGRAVDFIVVRDAEVRRALVAAHPYAKMVLQASVAIVPCGVPSRSIASLPEFWVQDAAAATENLLLGATALGLGAVWCGVYPDPHRVSAFSQVLGVPADVIPFAIVPIGYPAEDKEARTQYDAQRVHHERW